MVNENEYESAAGVHDDGELGDGNWGAEDSLRSNLPSLDRKVDEATPLLGNGAASGINSADNGHTIEVEWEGYGDLEGLSWWRRPSVSCTFHLPIPESKTDNNRFIGSCHHSSFSLLLSVESSYQSSTSSYH